MIDIGVFDTLTQARINTWRDLTAVVLETNEHGYSQLSGRCPLRLAEAYLEFSRRRAMTVRAVYNGLTIWEGRLEDVRLIDGGLELTAMGYQRALSDTLYTALWSLTRYDDWRPMTVEDRANTATEQYEADNNNRIYIAPRKDEDYTVSTTLGRVGYAAPSAGARAIAQLTFTYSVYLDTGWTARCISASGGLGGTPTVEWSLAGNGALQTGTATVTLTSTTADALRFEINPATGTYAGETGDRYLKITSLRVKSTTSAAVYADEIVEAVLASITAINPSQISPATVLIESPAVDLTDKIYEDARPAEILNRLISIGDNQTPPRQWEWGVWDDRRLHLRPRGSANRAWSVDATRINLESTLGALYNSVYAVYQNESGETVRTASASDADSLAQNGLTRAGFIGADTTSATQAGIERDTALNDTRTPRPRAALAFNELFDASGARWPLWACRSGDTVTIRNLPPQLGATVDRIRTFTVSETRYDVLADKLEVTPESPLPRIETLLARQAEGVK